MIVQGIHDVNQVRKSQRKFGNRKYFEPRFNQIEKDERLNDKTQIIQDILPTIIFIPQRMFRKYLKNIAVRVVKDT
ncbi:MAG: hypothetical protein KME30_02610 [Iphinoe sp. HA4291-MV1]|jgi:DNA repair exonuclease SbcCD ATPase subunit|nr:hypothetical protein [Iphinoe sp. HA4291-MV1]